MQIHVALAGLVLLTSHAAAQTFSVTDLSDADKVVILLFGDSGTGEAGQYRVGRAMVDVCRERGCRFGLAFGDVLYENGIRVDAREVTT